MEIFELFGVLGFVFFVGIAVGYLATLAEVIFYMEILGLLKNRQDLPNSVVLVASAIGFSLALTYFTWEISAENYFVIPVALIGGFFGRLLGKKLCAALSR